MGKIVKIILNKNWGRYDFFYKQIIFSEKLIINQKGIKKSTKKKSQIFQPNFLILYEHIEPADTSKPNFFCVKVDFCRHKSEKRKSFYLLATLTIRAVMARVQSCVHGTLQNLKLKPIG